jgi:hypothetical protein
MDIVGNQRTFEATKTANIYGYFLVAAPSSFASLKRVAASGRA